MTGSSLRVAEKLAAFNSDDIVVSRFGGDEFMIYLERVVGEAELTEIVDRVFARLCGDVDVGGHIIRVQASGGAVLSKVHKADVDGMIVKSDLALYKTKELGKNGWRLFEAAWIRPSATARCSRPISQCRRGACPSCRLPADRIDPLDAESPTARRSAAGIIRSRRDLPRHLHPLAEEMGIIADITTFVLDSGLHAVREVAEEISVSVNLSAKVFRSSDVVAKVKGALAKSGLGPQRLEIEVTETALLDDKAQTRTLLEEMKAIGVRIALDDFGTGYSSLSYCTRCRSTRSRSTAAS